MVSLAPVSSIASASQYDFECLITSYGLDVGLRRHHVPYRYPSSAFLRAYHSSGAVVVDVDAVDASNVTDCRRIEASGPAAAAAAAVAVAELGTDSTKIAAVVEEGSQPAVKEAGILIQAAAAAAAADSGRQPGSEVVAGAGTAFAVVGGSNDPGTGVVERMV